MDARGEPVVLAVTGLQALIDRLRAGGRTVIGPALADGAVTLAEITSVDDLPAGAGDEQAPGHYRLRDRADGALFGHAAPAASWKRLMFPPRELILAVPEAVPEADPEAVPEAGLEAGPDVAEPEPRPLALLGIRACDLHALRVLDHILLGREVADVRYARRRAGAFVVAVNCTAPGGTCFCAGLGTGPEADDGYDVRLTELLDGPAGDQTQERHRFVALAGTAAGAGLLGAVPATPATEADRAAAAAAVRAAAEQITRRLPAEGLREAVYAAAEHPHWESVASRCLACANCTLVCPTCFCTTIEDTSSLASGGRAPRTERWRLWDSCFTAGFSYLHGGSVRQSTAARYRQWLTHKLAAWSDQFGMTGCVGCGRCVTWCPAGIDLLAEAAAIRAPRTEA